jgi:hypothetical protein
MFTPIKKGEGKKRKLYKREIAWTMDQVINNKYYRLN